MKEGRIIGLEKEEESYRGAGRMNNKAGEGEEKNNISSRGEIHKSRRENDNTVEQQEGRNKKGEQQQERIIGKWQEQKSRIGREN